ncbi:hypothetical protein LCGC14_1192230 [marine sediment metagenome]|uniref:Uncharacterized protein n=1 Tax=marine sediment metagenome TaxID=412755 RepID=A0A0F9LJ68_9ZZZZ
MGNPNEVLKVQLRVPKWLWDAIGDCCLPITQSKNQFIIQAATQRVRNWTDPMTGEKVIQTITKNKPYDGWICNHGSHGSLVAKPAIECRSKGTIHKKGFEHPDYPRLKWDEYCREEGIKP